MFFFSFSFRFISFLCSSNMTETNYHLEYAVELVFMMTIYFYVFLEFIFSRTLLNYFIHQFNCDCFR